MPSDGFVACMNGNDVATPIPIARPRCFASTRERRAGSVRDTT